MFITRTTANGWIRSGPINFTRTLLQSSSTPTAKKASFLHVSSLRFNKEKNTKDNKQDEFYFEPSRLLPADKSSGNYQHLYKQIPVVCVFGWTGARDQNLVKFSQVYNSMGYHTLRISPSFPLVFLKLSKHKEYTEQLLRLMKDQYGLTDNKIFVHIISNAGAVAILKNIIDIQNSTYLPADGSLSVKDVSFFGKNQVGTIFDSCVGLNHPFWPLIQGIAGSINANVFVRYSIAVALSSAVSALLPFFPNNYFVRAFRTCTMDQRKLPTLFIYSKGDKLIDPKQIANWIEVKRKAFPDMYIKTSVFDDAEHVLIFKRYPDQYVELIKEHLRVCEADLNQFTSRK
jgi:hypothetical protein